MHGCLDVLNARRLCEIDMIEPHICNVIDADGNDYQFEAVNISLLGEIYCGRILDGFIVQHVLIREAGEQLKQNIYTKTSLVVFDATFIVSAEKEDVPKHYARSAREWHFQNIDD